MKDKSKLNIELIKRIQAHILEEPRRFFMGDWSAYWDGENWVVDESESGDPYADVIIESPDLAETPPACNTAHCIGGWANALTDPQRSPHNSILAAESLGLLAAGVERDWVFFTREWPEPFATDYMDAQTPQRRAEIAVARLDHLMEHCE